MMKAAGRDQERMSEARMQVVSLFQIDSEILQPSIDSMGLLNPRNVICKNYLYKSELFKPSIDRQGNIQSSVDNLTLLNFHL
eukprot:742226-Hanusia_phi.AAC.1